MREEGLVSLDEGGWEVAEGEPDIRGWDVVTSDGRKVGDVDDLLADPGARKVRYLTVDLDPDAPNIAGSERNITGSPQDRTVRIPISRARLNEQERRVVLDMAATNLNTANIASAPSQPWRDDTMRLTRSAEELHVGKRQVTTGEVEVKKRVETERVREPVTVRHEEVEVERRPVTGSAASRDVQISAQEVRVPVTEEEVVVEKRPVVREEVIISKHPVEEQRTVEGEVRNERIEVERHGDVRAHEGEDRNDRDRNKR